MRRSQRFDAFGEIAIVFSEILVLRPTVASGHRGDQFLEVRAECTALWAAIAEFTP